MCPLHAHCPLHNFNTISFPLLIILVMQISFLGHGEERGNNCHGEFFQHYFMFSENQNDKK